MDTQAAPAGNLVLIRHETPDWSNWYAAQLAKAFPAYDFRAAHTVEAAIEQAAEARVFIGIGPQMPGRLVTAMPHLEWIQTLTTEVDHFLHMPEMPHGVPITAVTGVHGRQMSELALTLMLALTRRLPGLLENQKAGRWDRAAQPLLLDKTVCILGLGQIAEMLAGYCRAFGMAVTGVSDGRSAVDGFARIYPRADLAAAAADADYLVVLVPLTPGTLHIVDAAVLDAMKPTAFLVNIARGGCVDEAALLAALQSGRIAGAGLDVFETEPLPADNPLWKAPNTIVTPHVGGFSDVYHKQCFPTVVRNFEAYAKGGPNALQNAIRL